MALKFPGNWRFAPPPDGEFINSRIPEPSLQEFIDVVQKVANQGVRRWDALEIFKGAFGASGRSSNESWAESDLERAMAQAAENAPLFLDQLFNGFERLRVEPDGWFVPDAAHINAILLRNNVGYEVRLPDLIAREANSSSIAVRVPEPSLEERARATIHASLERSEELLIQGYSREAVQECLWLLETVSTAFKGIATESGKVEGKYFNKIVKDLRSKHSGKTLEQILGWIFSMHGYLSSPTGGGVRHGMDLDQGVDLDQNQARLFCNLIRSYIQFLLVEHDAIGRRGRP
jgi:hypothetical protein